MTLAAGCTAKAISDEYKDADKRFANQVGGVEQTTKTVTVPAGAKSLVVKAAYSVGGVATFELEDPSGRSVKKDSITGGKETRDASWFELGSPAAGDWKLRIDVSGGAEYAFGFYY